MADRSRPHGGRGLRRWQADQIWRNLRLDPQDKHSPYHEDSSRYGIRQERRYWLARFLYRARKLLRVEGAAAHREHDMAGMEATDYDPTFEQMLEAIHAQ